MIFFLFIKIGNSFRKAFPYLARFLIDFLLLALSTDILRKRNMILPVSLCQRYHILKVCCETIYKDHTGNRIVDLFVMFINDITHPDRTADDTICTGQCINDVFIILKSCFSGQLLDILYAFADPRVKARYTKKR